MAAEQDTSVGRMCEFNHGEIIFRQGAESDQVGWIRQGSVEIVKELETREVILGRVGADEFVGEMGVLEARRRNATVRAADRVSIEFLDPAAFLERISQDRTMALRVLTRLSERLRASDDRIVALESIRGGRMQVESIGADGPEVILIAASEAVGEALPKDGLKIDRFPFTVGRRINSGERAPATEVDLAIADNRPYRLSRTHFSLVQTAEGLVVADTNSTLGTAVNGQFLGENFPQVRAPLKEGENEVVAGGVQSPYRFKIVVRASAKA